MPRKQSKQRRTKTEEIAVIRFLWDIVPNDDFSLTKHKKGFFGSEELYPQTPFLLNVQVLQLVKYSSFSSSHSI